jgi:DNA-binding LacI/PurR family transcriptional regulator
MERVTLRVLLIADFDIFRSAIETCHEVFDLLSGIRDAAAEFGCEVQQVSREGHEHLRKASNGTGYLIIAMSHAEFEEGVRLAGSQNAPCVLVNPGHGGQNCVRVDMEQGAFLGTNYLAQLGHRRIAYVGRTDTEWSEPRFAGYQRALALNGLPLDTELIREKSNGIDPQQDWNAMDELLALPQPPTAIFAASDYRALHLLSYCKRKGISVPEQLSLCGYDDISEVASVEPALTTVRHPRQELGRAAVELITRLLREGSRGAADTVIKPHLVLRESCAPPGR